MNKSCKECRETPLKRGMCQPCFNKSLEKKVDSVIKKNFKYQQSVKILNNESLAFKLIKSVVEKNNHVKLIEVTNSGEADVLPKTLNDVSKDFFVMIGEKGRFLCKDDFECVVVPLENYTDKELEFYFNVKSDKNYDGDVYGEFVDSLESKNSEFLLGVKRFIEKLK